MDKQKIIELKKKLKDYQKKRTEVLNEINTLEDQLDQEYSKNYSSYVGSCYVYKDNSYGGGKKWNIYYKIINYLKKEKSFKVLSIQFPSFGKLIEINEYYIHDREKPDCCFSWHYRISSNIFNEQLSKVYHILTMSKLK